VRDRAVSEREEERRAGWERRSKLKRAGVAASGPGRGERGCRVVREGRCAERAECGIGGSVSAGARGGWAQREEELAGLRASGTRDWAAGAGEGSKLGHGEREKEGAGWAGLGWFGCWAAWAEGWVWVSFLFLGFPSSFLFLIQTKLNLFEFKFEFEFKPHSIK
jgi:hypothetical protein